MKDGESETGLRLCVYETKLEADMVFVESPGEPKEEGWELVRVEPVSEGKRYISLSSSPLGFSADFHLL